MDKDYILYTIKQENFVGINFVVSLKFHLFVIFVAINFADLEQIALVIALVCEAP